MADEQPRPGDESAGPSGESSETREQPGLAETAEHAPIDAPEVDAPTGGPARPATTGPDRTSVMPPVPDAEPGPSRWSARAQVRPPDVDQPVEWDEAADHEPRGAFVPVLIITCVVLLLALICLGVWLFLRARDVAPITPPTDVITSSPGTPTRPPTRPATTVPPTTAAAEVAIPELRGKDYETAAAELVTLGFVPTRQDESASDVPAGRVIGTDPPAGNVLAPGTMIIVRVSTGAPTVAPTGESSPP